MPEVELLTTTTPLAEISPNLVQKRGVNRVYISNLNFNATEEDLEDLFKSFKLVLIPSHTIRGFRSSHHRPLGIAYAEVGSIEEVQKACEELDGCLFKDRKLKVKPHTPYNPQKLIGKAPNPSITPPESIDDENQYPVTLLKEEKETQVQMEPEKLNKKDPLISKDTIFVGKLSHKTTEVELRAYFEDYGVGDIYIFKGHRVLCKYHNSLKFRKHNVSALVEIISGNELVDVIGSLKDKKINNRSIELRPALVSKLEKVKKAATLNGDLQEVTKEEENQEKNLDISEDNKMEKLQDSIDLISKHDDGGDNEVVGTVTVAAYEKTTSQLGDQNPSLSEEEKPGENNQDQ